MADTKISGLAAENVLLPTDYVVVVDDPAVTPVTKKALVSAIQAVVIKTASETVNNSIVLINDATLLFPVEANRKYRFEFVLLCNSANVTGDIQFAITAPLAGAVYWSGYFGVDAASTPVLRASTGVQSFGSVAGNFMIVLKGVAILGATAGNIQLQWAQNTAHASDTKVMINSHVIFSCMY